VSASETHRAIHAVWRIESPRLIAGLARLLRDVGLAEELAQDALLAALTHWPESGVPDNPGAWLMATAKRRGIDELRRRKMLERKHEELCLLKTQREQGVPDMEGAIDDQVGDNLLSLIFTSCHPVLSSEARVALTLRLLGGLTGLVALMEIQASRVGARTDAQGEPIMLLAQNRARWDHVLIGRGLSALRRAEALGGTPGPYAVQAAIAACHARALTPEHTDWQRIAALYEQLQPSPVVELNRSVAVAMAHGPEAGLAIVDALQGEPSLKSYHLLPCVRADFLVKLGRFGEAHADLTRAISMTKNAREQTLLQERADACARGELPSR